MALKGDSSGKGSGVLAAIISAIPAIYQGISGAVQRNRANKIEDQNPRPDASIMESINKLVNYNYGRTLVNDIPGGDLYRDEIKGASAAGIRAASELNKGSEAYGALGKIISNEQGSFADMAKVTAQQVAGYQGNYANSLLAKANEEERMWNWNTGNKYLQAAQIAAQLRNSGTQNIFSGISNLAGVASESIAPDFHSSLNGYGATSNNRSNITADDVAKIIQSLPNFKSYNDPAEIPAN